MTDAGLAYLASPEVLATFLSAAYDSSLVQKSNFFRSVSPRPLCSELCFTTLAHSFGLQMTSNLGAGSELSMRQASILMAKNSLSSLRTGTRPSGAFRMKTVTTKSQAGVMGV
jgi:hypothetical protein